MPKKSVDEPIIEFRPKLPKLSLNERKVLELLVQACRLIVPIYLEQEKQAKVKIDREEIERAAKTNPSLLSRYTVIEKINGKLVAIPYHIKYTKLLAPIVKKLYEAAKITDSNQFGKALRTQAKALLTGSYDEATIAWLRTKPYILDISIGPLHHFDDQLLFSKASYHAWMGVVEQEGTDRLNNYKSVILSARRRVITPGERIEAAKIRAKVLDVLLFSGLMARTKFVGLNLPINIGIVEKYGAQVTLFNQPNDLRIKEQISPTFKKIFSRGFKQGFDPEDLRRGYLRITAIHELAHSYLYYKNSMQNLQDLFPTISELAATILGLRLSGTLLLKERITNKQLESMVVTFICRSIYLMEGKKQSKFLLNYAIGGTIFINFMLESGALQQFDHSISVNFTKIFVSINDLLHILEKLLARGTRKDTESFIHKYSASSEFAF